MDEPRDDRPDAEEEYRTCPACGGRTVQERCKVICRSATCIYRVVYNCSEF